MSDIGDFFTESKISSALIRLKVAGCPIGVYCGYSADGNMRIAFSTNMPPVYIESTLCLRVSQWEEAAAMYWTCFELLVSNAKPVFIALCNDLIEAATKTETSDAAINAVRNRFCVWKKMFKNTNGSMNEETYKGLFGELYFLKNWMFKQYDITAAVRSWSGPSRTAKDFSIGEDWYEAKTVSTNAETVKISSLTQLSSTETGKLVVIKTEQMSNEFDNCECTVEDLITDILNLITDATVKDEFIGKVINYGYDINSSEESYHKYRVASLNLYRVSCGFPRITEKEVPFDEIARVTYELSLCAIGKFLEGE